LSLRELAARTGYGEKQVRVALRRLVEARALVATEAPGQPARYRLGDAALGRGAPLPSPVSAAVAAPAGPGTVAPAPTAGSAPALRLTLGGVTVSLAAGLTAHVAYDADGVPHLTVPPSGHAGR
jgi:hypothetical protein